MNEETKAFGVEKIRILYVIVQKYCKHCRSQGHAERECSVFHPKLKKIVQEEVQEE